MKKTEPVSFTYRKANYSIPKDCMKGLVIGGLLGKGVFSEVHDAEVKGLRKYVVKIIKLDIPPAYEENSDEEMFHERHTSKEMFNREVFFQKKAASIGVAPKIKRAFICASNQREFIAVAPRFIVGLDVKGIRGGFEAKVIEFGFIIMEKLTISLSAYIRENLPDTEFLEKIRKILIEKINLMHSHGIFHGDMRPDNVMLQLNKDGDVSDLKIIDYGMAGTSATQTDSNLDWMVDDEYWKLFSGAYPEGEEEDED